MTDIEQVIADMLTLCDNEIDPGLSDAACNSCGDEPDVSDGREWTRGDWCWECWQKFGEAVRPQIPILAAEIAKLREANAVMREALLVQAENCEGHPADEPCEALKVLARVKEIEGA